MRKILLPPLFQMQKGKTDVKLLAPDHPANIINGRAEL